MTAVYGLEVAPDSAERDDLVRVRDLDSARPVNLLDIPPGSKLLFVASTGGHLTQLARLAAQLEASLDSTWITFESHQSHSLLAQYSDVRFLPYVAPRDYRGVLRTVRKVAKIGRAGDYYAAISTGAGVALALPFLSRRRTRRIYVESVSRVDGPSRSGKILARVPLMERRTQHPGWASKRWPYEFTLLDDYQVVPRPRLPESRPLSMLVTLGTIKPFRFDAMLDAVNTLLQPGDRVVWQVGCTDRTDLPGVVMEHCSREELHGVAAQCDVVLSHAGVGTALDLLDLGIHPVLVPRRAAHGEHVDDHQAEIGELLAGKGLATVRTADRLTREDLLASAGKLVLSRADVGLDELSELTMLQERWDDTTGVA